MKCRPFPDRHHKADHGRFLQCGQQFHLSYLKIAMTLTAERDTNQRDTVALWVCCRGRSPAILGSYTYARCTSYVCAILMALALATSPPNHSQQGSAILAGSHRKRGRVVGYVRGGQTITFADHACLSSPKRVRFNLSVTSSPRLARREKVHTGQRI